MLYKSFVLRVKYPYFRLVNNLHAGCALNKSELKVAGTIEEDDGIKIFRRSKLSPRLPLVKNFFIGVVDKELLAFPEVISRDEMSKLQNDMLPLRNFFHNDYNRVKSDLTVNFKQLGLYGLNISQDYGGKGCGYTGSLLSSEPETEIADLALSLSTHRAVIDVLQEKGTLEQQQEFLPRLANGSMVACEALYDADTPTEELFSTKANYNPDTKMWCINGRKSFVLMPPKSTHASQLFVVLAQTLNTGSHGEGGVAVSMFLVDSHMKGVKFEKKLETLGCRECVMQIINFNNVEVPESRVLGKINDAKDVTDLLQLSTRLRTSLIALTQAKKILNISTDYCTNKMQYGILVKDFESVQIHLANMTLSVYGMESMIYLTASFLDEFQNPDVNLEAAITKYFSLKEHLNIAIGLVDLIGATSLLSGEDSEVYFRNAAQLYTQGESLDNLSIYTSMEGLKHAGNLIGDSIRKQRNPLFHPAHILLKLLERSNIDSPKTKMRLCDNLHPSLDLAALQLEHSVTRLKLCVDLLLTHYGSIIVQCHKELSRLADITTILYQMFATLSRASRSYCIGLQHSKHEIMMAAITCMRGNEQIKMLSSEIFNGRHANNDNNLLRLTKHIVKNKCYFPEHPLTYNF